MTITKEAVEIIKEAKKVEDAVDKVTPKKNKYKVDKSDELND